MRTRKRLKGLQKWMQENLCAGREMKAPAPNFDITQIIRQEPECYIAWQPTRPDLSGRFQNDVQNVCPGILIMPAASKVKDMEEKRFDRYNGVSRPKDLGQTLSVSILFSVYEPGIRLPGFIDDPEDMSKIIEGTEEGLFMNESSAAYSLYTDQSYVVDKRPIYYGFVNVEFGCYANAGNNPNIDNYLK